MAGASWLTGLAAVWLLWRPASNLGRRIREIAVLLIVSYRNDELADTHPLRIALGHLAVQRCARRLPLAPLSAQAVRMLSAGRGVDPEEPRGRPSHTERGRNLNPRPGLS